MALTGTEETDLLLPLFREVAGNQGFCAFLEKLRRRTGADHIALVLRRNSGTTGPDSATISFAGRDLDSAAELIGAPAYHQRNAPFYDMLRPGRVYGLSELIEHDRLTLADRAREQRRIGIADERVVRISGEEDWTAWLVLSRIDRCGADDSALLSSLVPYLSAALDQRHGLDRMTQEARLAEAAMSRSGKGWILFDRDARISAIDTATRLYWAEHCGAMPRVGERLVGLPAGAQRQLAGAAAALADRPAQPARAIALHEAPWIEALLTAAPGETPAHPERRRVLALCHLPVPQTADAAERFASVHDVPRREAELALGLAHGLSLAEAGEAMGLTLETTRNYSKKLYARLGVRGQAELVRKVYEGTAVMA